MIEEEWSKPNKDNRNSEPYPVSPFIGETEVKEIGQLEAEELAPGVVVVHNLMMQLDNYKEVFFNF